jgi:hypothetical protein
MHYLYTIFIYKNFNKFCFLSPGDHFEPSSIENYDKVVMQLRIKSVDINDFGSYKCVAKNSFGSVQKTIEVYRKYLEPPTHYSTDIQPTTTTDTTTLPGSDTSKGNPNRMELVFHTEIV